MRDLRGTTRPKHVLRSHASPYRGPLDPRRTHKFGGSWASIAPLMSVIMNVSMDPNFEPFSSVDVYYGHRFGGVIMVHRMGTRFSGGADFLYAVGVSDEPSSGAGHPIIQPFERSPISANIHALDVLFAEWLYERERRGSARQFLCDALAEEIAKQRAKAERDFDTAVAVSADGTKICSADWVCVFGASSTKPPPSDRHGFINRSMFRATDYLFPASAFQAQKILLTPRTKEEDDPPAAGPFTSPGSFKNTWAASNRSVDESFNVPEQPYGKWYRTELASTRCHHPRQALLVCKDGRVLFVHRDQCPDPLPDGGVEVTV